MTDLAKLVVRLEAEIGKYQANLEKADKQLAKFTNSADSLLGNLAGTFAAFFTIDRLRAWGSMIVENADQVGKLAQRSGVAVDELSKLLYTFDQGGINGEAFTTMLRKLNDNLSDAAGNAKGQAAGAFRAMGIEVKDATGRIRSADAVLVDIADRFAGYADGANKSALATQLLGKQGEAAIPILNGGADGLKRMGDEAQRLGAVISEDLAKQAAEFNDRLDRLKTLLIDGIGNRVAAELLPTLNALGAEFEQTADKSLLLERTSQGIATAIKALTDVGLGASTAFVKLGNAIGGGAAAAAAAARGEFSLAGEIIDQVTADNLQIEADYQKARAALWKQGGEEVLQEVEITAKRIQEEAPNLAGGKALEDATRKAIDSLKDMASKLNEQVATFGMTEAAVLRYRLEVGDLSDEVKTAGAAGDELAASLIRQAEALEKLKSAKEVADALAQVNVQILQLQGNTADAEIAEFDRKNAELVTALRAQGNEEGLRQLETLTKLKVAQIDFNASVEQAASIQSELQRTEDRIRNSREAGAISELTMQEQLSEARQKAAGELQVIYEQQLKIAEQTGNPALIENVKRFGGEIENLKAQASLLGDSLRKGLEDNFSSSLKMLITDIHNAEDAFGSFIQGVADQLLELATQQLTQQILGAFSTMGGGGSGGNWFTTLAGAFAGGRASGGSVQEGMAYKINENTPNSEWFVPGRSGTVVPMEKMGGTQVHQTFVLQAPQGSVSRQTQMQVGAQAAKGLASANRRNN